MAMKTIGDLLRVLNYYKENYPEFEKYLLCIDASPDDEVYHDFRDIELYINSDIGQVEIMISDEE